MSLTRLICSSCGRAMVYCTCGNPKTESELVQAVGSAVVSRIDEALALIRSEALRAYARHRPMHSPHEGYAVIKGELEELWEWVKKDDGGSNLARDEALQVAAMGLRYVIDVAPIRPFCAACDRGDYQLGHVDGCPQNTQAET